jgi:hypothetical protein
MTKFGAVPLYENPTPEQTRECAHWIARKTHDLYITSGTFGRWKAANEDPTFPDQSYQLWEPKAVEGLNGTHYTERVYRRCSKDRIAAANRMIYSPRVPRRERTD